MTRAPLLPLVLLVAFTMHAPFSHAELPPPAARGLAPPQQPPAAQQALPTPPQRNPGKPPEFFAARRQAQIDRKEAAKKRMREFKAERAAREEKLYEDWHDRYLADTPVRVEYYRAMARAYEVEAAYAYYAGPYYYYSPPAILSAYPIYAPYYGPAYTPICQPFIYGTVFSWGW